MTHPVRDLCVCTAAATIFVTLATWGDTPPREIPDPALTPGAVASTSQSEVCSTTFVPLAVWGEQSYSKAHRQTPAWLKASVMRAYGQVPRAAGDGEVDHLIPLSLGGADVRENLWWQPGDGHGATWTYHDKDKLEFLFWERVCRLGTMTLHDAQAAFGRDWRQVYCETFTDRRCP